MTYELVKELKDAGFPQHYDSRWGRFYYMYDASDNDQTLIQHQTDHVCYDNALDDSQLTFVPTLSELIEACGDCLSHIKKYNGNWWAVSHCGHPEHEPGGNNLEMAEITPEEAVARLWLALNKNV